MKTIFEKVDKNTLAVIEVIPERIIPEEVKPAKEYKYSFLVEQAKQIQSQWDEMIAQKNKEIEEINTARQAELDEVNTLIAEADKLEISDEVEEAVEELPKEVPEEVPEEITV